MTATAFASGWLATEYGLRPYPFYLGIILAVLGLLGSLLVRDTCAHVALEAIQAPAAPTGPPLSFWDATWRHPNLGAGYAAHFDVSTAAGSATPGRVKKQETMPLPKKNRLSVFLGKAWPPILRLY